MDAPRGPRTKLRHLEACLTQPVEYRKTTGLERYELLNEALPELHLAQLDLSCELAGKQLRAPLMIAPMTGGNPRAHELNRRLATVAEEFGLGFGIGSQRIALEDPQCAAWFGVRDVAPRMALFANLGAAQLAQGYGADEARRAVAMIGADALFVHLNPVQEAVKDGDSDFRNVGTRLERLCRALADDGIPVFAREVCFGLTESTAARLVDCGVAGIDCAGAGGTSWAKVEAYCAASEQERALGLQFGEWGIPTAESILNVRRAAPGLPLIASGGLRNGVDVAKALALGADVGAMARPMLVRADEGEESLRQFVAEVIAELRICMFATGSANVAALRGKAAPVAVASGSDAP
jgi:isopentenyl-diphosphate delta-isomerase